VEYLPPEKRAKYKPFEDHYATKGLLHSDPPDHTRMRNVIVKDFTPNVVVTLQKVSADIGKAEQLLDAQNQQLVKKLKATDLSSTPTQVCGATALATSYTAPEVKISPKIPPIPPRKATSLGVVYKTGDVSYVATLTVQTVKPDNPTYIKDADTITKGFQLLPAS